MNILVTGGAGYIGSHVARQLSESGSKPIILDNLSAGFKEALINNEILVEGDVGDVELVSSVIRKYQIDSVLHFAASIVVPESVSDPLKYYRNNTLNTLQLISVCAKEGVKNFIFSSTAAVYGLPKDGMAKEEDLCDPLSPYGSSKFCSEMILKDVAAAHKLKYVVLRYFNVAGADPKHRTGQRSLKATHLIKVVCETIVGKREKVEIFGSDYKTRDGTCIRDYIHIEDLAAAHLLALDYLREGSPSTTLNVGYGKGNSVAEVIEVAKKVSGIAFNTEMKGRRPGDAGVLIARAEKLRALLGWKPKFDSLEKIISDALEWEKKL